MLSGIRGNCITWAHPFLPQQRLRMFLGWHNVEIRKNRKTRKGNNLQAIGCKISDSQYNWKVPLAHWVNSHDSRSLGRTLRISKSLLISFFLWKSHWVYLLKVTFHYPLFCQRWFISSPQFSDFIAKKLWLDSLLY